MFEVGKKVVCIKAHQTGLIKVGDIFTILGIRDSFCHCPYPELNIGVATPEEHHDGCHICGIGKEATDNYWWFCSSRFRLIDYSFADQAIEKAFQETFVV